MATNGAIEVRRRTIHVDGLDHGTQPFPIATRVDNLLVTSGIHGRDRRSGELSADPAVQIAQMFDNIGAVLSAGGATPADVAQVLVTLADGSYRPILNEHWSRMFPDEADRPVRNTQFRSLGGGTLCSAIVTAVLASTPG